MAKPVQSQRSFGQQIRERLSRSKSRLSRFLHPSQAKRAQSTPNTKVDDHEDGDEDDDDRDLVQPGDIARNCEQVVAEDRSSFDASLDRHLSASLAAGKPQRKSSTESSSQISGLDTSARSSRSKGRKSKLAQTGVQSSKPEEKRPTSLLSIRRLSGLRQTKQEQRQNEDLDSLKLSTTGNEPNQKVANSRRRKGRRSRSKKTKSKSPGGDKSGSTRSNSSSGSSSGSQRSPIVAKMATTNEYFGQVAPAKVASDDSDSDKVASSPGEVSKKAQVATENSASGERVAVKRPNRSQSLKSVGSRATGAAMSPKSSLKPGSASLRDQQRTVSFSNLNRQRLPLPTNSFRPVSACAQLEHPPDVELIEGRQSAVGQVTPVAPTSCSIELLPESAKPPQLSPRNGQLSPIRAKSSAMLEDFRSKCNQLFSSGSPTTARKQPPVRPPRRYNFRGRSKSSSGKQQEGQVDNVIVASAASPTGSTLSRCDEVTTTGAANTTKQPLGQKLSTFAHHLKESAADFFHPAGNNNPDQRRSRSRTKEPQSVEKPATTLTTSTTTTTTTDDTKNGTSNNNNNQVDPLCVWQPVIQSNRRPASARRSLVGSIGGLKGKLTNL